MATVPVQAAAFAGEATTTALTPEMAIAEETATTPRRENFFIQYSFQRALDFPTCEFCPTGMALPIVLQNYLFLGCAKLATVTKTL